MRRTHTELGVRDAVLFRDRNDDDRNSLQWGDVDLERDRIVVYGKSREYDRRTHGSRSRRALASRARAGPADRQMARVPNRARGVEVRGRRGGDRRAVGAGQ